MGTNTLISRIKRHRKGELLTPLIDDFFRKASINGGVKFSPTTMGHLIRLFMQPDRERTGCFSASSLAGCMRAQVLRYNGEEEVAVPSERREAIFFNGHWIHLKWGGILLELGVVRHQAQHPYPDLELLVEVPEWNLLGSLDAICVLEDDWIVDVKGVGPFYWDMIKRGDIPLAYRWQQQAYMRATGIPRAMLLVENKGTGEYMEVHLPPPDSEVALQMEARVRALNRFLELERLPEKLVDFPRDRECGDCVFRELCPKAEFIPHRSVDF